MPLGTYAQAEFEGRPVLLTAEELAHAMSNPGFEELFKLCPGAARCKALKPTAARCKAASGFSAWRAFGERYRTWIGLRRPHCTSF